jgi:hypothetical protein
LKLGVPQTHDDTLVTAEDTTATIAALANTDGSETLSVAISALPIGAILTDGAYRFTATSRETANGVTATMTIGLAVVVLPVDDAPPAQTGRGASSCAPPCLRAITTRSPSARPPLHRAGRLDRRLPWPAPGIQLSLAEQTGLVVRVKR